MFLGRLWVSCAFSHGQSLFFSVDDLRCLKRPNSLQNSLEGRSQVLKEARVKRVARRLLGFSSVLVLGVGILLALSIVPPGAAPSSFAVFFGESFVTVTVLPVVET